MRLFFALNFDDVVRRRIAEVTAPLREAAPHVAWVQAGLLHVTLKFLGEVDDARLAACSALGEACTRGEPAHRITLAGAGAFPNLRRPRVVWMGMRDADAVVRIAQRLDQGAEGLAVARETRPFRPHVTLGRVKSELPRGELSALAHAAAAMRDEQGCFVRSVDLMRSSPGAGGSRYEVLAVFPLGGA